MTKTPDKISADFKISGATLITMDPDRRVIYDGTIAVSGNRIVWLGAARDADAHLHPCQTIDGKSLIISPGFINGHVHITGDPLTRHFMPDDLADEDKLFSWVIPRYYAHNENDEELSATFCAIELLKSGTTTFIEAGTIRHLDGAVAGLRKTGIRGRVGDWVEGRDFENPANQPNTIDEAIAKLENEIEKYPDKDDALISAWPILVGHTTNPDEVWQAAKNLADQNNLCVAAHMSPYASDPEWFLQTYGHRPIEHLEQIGVLGANTILTHATHLDDSEVDIIQRTKTNIAFCPFATLKGAFGAAHAGKYVELLKAGAKFALATDGYDTEILPAARIGTALFKDLGHDVTTSAALRGLEMITCEAAEIIGLADEIGSLEVGKKADFVCFDSTHTQWRPLLSPLDQLLWSADARSLKHVWVDGQHLIENGQSTRVDERQLLEDVQTTAENIIQKSGLPFRRQWVSLDRSG